MLGAGNEPNVSRERLVALIKASEGKPLPLQIQRGGTVQTVTVTPKAVNGQVMIGAQINPWEVRTVDPGPLEAVKLSVQKN